MPRYRSGFWIPERVVELRRLWAAGDTTATIGREIGCSKNAVISKARRERLPVRRRSPKMIAAQARVKLMSKQLPDGCRWIEGDPRSGDWSYCQHETLPDSDYCAAHRARCFSGRRAA